MSKFKVGDKVRVKKDLKINEIYNTYTYTDGMYYGYGAKILTIDEIDSLLGDHYHVKEDRHHFAWTDDMLELVAPKSFTKPDLKDGMVVEYRNGRRRLVLNEKFIGEDGNTHFNDFNNDLTSAKDGRSLFGARFQDFDIMKVYSTAAEYTKYLFAELGFLKIILLLTSIDELTLIWEREEESEHKEMTVEEIEKELGYKIKVVGDSSCQK